MEVEIIVDITPIFWDIAQNIVSLEYKALKETESFIKLVEYVENRDEFMFHYQNIELYFIDVNDLFYGILDFCKKHQLKELSLMEHVIQKMENFIKLEEIENIFSQFNLN
jgi:hypothetical protein